MLNFSEPPLDLRETLNPSVMTEYLPVKPYLQCNFFQATNLASEHWVCLALLGLVLPPVLIVSQYVRLYANDCKVFVSVQDTPWISFWEFLHFLHKCSSSSRQASHRDYVKAESAVPGTAHPQVYLLELRAVRNMCEMLWPRSWHGVFWEKKRDLPFPYFLSARVMVQGGLYQTKECKDNGTCFSLPTHNTKWSCCLELLSSLESCFVKPFLRQRVLQVCFVSWLSVGSAFFFFLQG